MLSTSHVRAALALALVFTFKPVFAQSATEAETVVVTASRTEQRMRDAIPHTTILTRKDIRDSQAVDLPTLLRGEAGFEFSQNGGIGTTSSTFLRGVATNRVLVLIDGVRVSSLTTGATALDQLMLDQIERVEVVRGNVSALYGSGAIGGVIQVFTQRGQGEPRASIEVGIGEENTRRLRAGIAGAAGDTSFSLNLSHYATDGFSALEPGISPTANPDRDGYRNLSLSGYLAHRIAKDHEVGARFLSSKGDIEFDNAFAASVNDRHSADAEVGAWTLYANNRLAAAWLSKLAYSEGRDAFDAYLNGAVTSRTRSRNRQLTWQNDFPLTPDHTLTAGLEKLRQSVSSTTAYTRPGRDLDALFAGYQGRLGRHAVQLNARNEDHSDFGAVRTHFVGYGFDLTDAVRLTASHASGFRAPTFNELFFPLFGNPNLRPERSRSSEVGAQYAVDSQLVRIVAFHMRVTDLINPFPVFNVNNATIDGVEASYRGTLLGAEVRASLTLQEPIQHTAAAHQQLIRRAKLFASFSVGKSFGPWRLGAALLASGQRFDSHPISGVRLALQPYELLNLTARYQFDAKTAVSARLENALDRHYTLAKGFNTQERKLMVSVSHTF